jgi:hypothetical protein
MLRRALAISVLVLCACAAGCGSPPPASVDAGTIEPTYENVAMIMQTGCALSRACHGTGAPVLDLQTPIAAGMLREALLDVPSCEYDAWPLVTAGDPSRSWLYYKVAGEHSGRDLVFTPESSWDRGGLVPDAAGTYPPSMCPLTERGMISFGDIMPQGSMGLDAPRASAIRAWIEAGAPGPD